MNPEEYLVHLDQVCVSRGGLRVLDRVEWTLRPGENWAVLGRNGAGKSTFLRLVRGDVWPDARDGGTRTYGLDEPVTESPIQARRVMAMLSPEDADWYAARDGAVTGVEVVLAGFFDGPFLYSRPSPDQEKAALQALELMGVRQDAARPMNELSRGQGVRVLLARCLARGPRVMLLDECLDGLDAEARPRVLEALDRVARTGVSLVFATHRPDAMPLCVTHCLEMEGGRITRQGPLAGSHAGGGSEEEDFEAGVFPQVTPCSCPWLVRLENARVVLSEREILHPVDWTMAPDENWAVTGDNGAGKSTLLSLVLGLVPPQSDGRVGRFGKYLGQDDLRQTRRNIGFVSARLQARYHPEATVMAVALSGLDHSVGVYRDFSDQERDVARQWLARMGLEGLEDRELASLSYGQARRALLARAMVGDPALLLLDEPCSGLDPHCRARILDILERLTASGVRMVFVTHHRSEIPAAVTHEMRLEKGRVVRSGPLKS